MKEKYETSRLQLRILNETCADRTLGFYTEGRQAFSPYEPQKHPAFYTLDYQQAVLRGEYKAYLAGSYIRYYIFMQEAPERIIGTISLSNILKEPYRSCVIGYKLLPEYQKKGYAIEAVSHIITAAFEEEKLHRIEALVLPDNIPSISLLRRLGFNLEGVAASIIRLKDGYTDHCRYVLINPMD